MVKRRAISAGYGINSWIQQRVTAVIMLIAVVAVFVFLFLASGIVTSQIISWQQFFSCTFVKIFTQLVFFAVMLHAWVGIRDLWMDYVKSCTLRITLYVLTILWLSGCFIYSAIILWL